MLSGAVFLHGLGIDWSLKAAANAKPHEIALADKLNPLRRLVDMDFVTDVFISALDVLSAWSWLLPALAGAVLMLLFVWLFHFFKKSGQSKGVADAEQSLDASYRFAAMSPITSDQVDLLQYLQKAFPDGAVLYRPRLGSFLSVRAGAKRMEARERLQAIRVDYLLCGEDGKPLYAFEVDMLRGQAEPAQQKALIEKNRILRSAGIRMIRFKGSVATWPKPEKLRERVLAVGTPLNSGFDSSGYAASGFTPSGFASSGFASSRLDSSGRVQHGPDPGNPWTDTRSRF